MRQPVDEMKRLRAKGYSYRKIGEIVGCDPTTVSRYVRNVYRSRRGVSIDAIAKIDAPKLIKQIPKDTRSFTSLFFGDPLPGRSALDQYQSVYGLSQEGMK